MTDSPDNSPFPAPIPTTHSFRVEADQDALVLPHKRVTVKTRLQLDMAPGVKLNIQPYPHNPAGLFVAAGDLPEDHQGTIYVTLCNFGDQTFEVHSGATIAVANLEFPAAPVSEDSPE